MLPSRLAISTNGDRQTHVLWDDSQGHHQITCGIDTNGPNALDSGTASNDQQYCQFIISDINNVNPVATLFSLSPISPTLPSGYNLFQLVGFKYLNPSGVFRKELQVGQTVYMETAFPIMTNGTTQNSWTQIHMDQQFSPPDYCWEMEFYGVHDPCYSSTGVRQIWMGVRSSLMYNSERVLINENVYVGSGSNLTSGKAWYVTDEGSNDIWWQVSSDGANRTSQKTHLYVTAYKLRLE